MKWRGRRTRSPPNWLNKSNVSILLSNTSRGFYLASLMVPPVAGRARCWPTAERPEKDCPSWAPGRTKKKTRSLRGDHSWSDLNQPSEGVPAAGRDPADPPPSWWPRQTPRGRRQAAPPEDWLRATRDSRRPARKIHVVLQCWPSWPLTCSKARELWLTLLKDKEMTTIAKK